MRWPQREAEQRSADPAASMALLQEVLDRPVDPGYQSAARQRELSGMSGPTSLRSPLLLVTLVLLGFLLSVAAVALRTPDPQDAMERAELAERVEAAGVAGDDYANQIEGLRTDIADLEAAASRGPGPDLGEEISLAGERAGALAVHGPGVQITLDDRPEAELDAVAEPEQNSDRVLAGDVQLMVNGLWSVGAEAISINGQRLTSTSSIRFAGEAIIVDFRGLTRPYEIHAIGDPAVLAEELADGATGQYFDGLSADYGIVMEWEDNVDVMLPAAERLITRVAVVDDAKEEIR